MSETPRRTRNTGGYRSRSRSRGGGNLVRGIPLNEDDDGSLSEEDNLTYGFRRVLHGVKAQCESTRRDSCFDENSFDILLDACDGDGDLADDLSGWD